MLTKSEVSKLLGRSLSSLEDQNFDTYIKIATERLEDLLCMKICGDDSARVYQTRKGYRTLFVDPFKDIISITVDGDEVTDYVKKLNESYSGSWYNSIEFDDRMTGKLVTVDADWGFTKVPTDLALLLSKLFAQGSVEQKSDNQVKSKKIEDFTVTYKDGSTFDEFVSVNQATVDKYSLCHVGRIEHGSVRAIRYDRLHVLEA